MNIPPIHPALVHLPIAFVILSVAADFGARLSRDERRRAILRTLGFWSLVAALGGGVLTIVAGYIDLNRAALTPELEEFVQVHIVVGWILAGILALLTAWRWLIWHRGQMTINSSYLVGSFLLLSITLFQGWYGGEMVYSYGAGVAPMGHGTESADAAQRRLLAVRNLLQPGSAIGGANPPDGIMTDTNGASGGSTSTNLSTSEAPR
ncbi:MAG TPA: DUF2231 domain-containing protein [Verrucomicrobiae bacterium]|nr:DUF2231 domain-containing protein [Verrucomicrobiae bacterium]